MTSERVYDALGSGPFWQTVGLEGRLLREVGRDAAHDGDNWAAVPDGPGTYRVLTSGGRPCRDAHEVSACTASGILDTLRRRQGYRGSPAWVELALPPATGAVVAAARA